MSRKRDVFQLDDNDAPDANTSDAVGWSCDDGLGYGMLAKYNDKIHSEWASVCAADCDDELLVARIVIHGVNHEVEDSITIHRVNGIAGIVEASPELPFKVSIVPKRRDILIVEAHDLVTDKNSRRTGYGMPYISIAAVYESLALATTVRNDCR